VRSQPEYYPAFDYLRIILASTVALEHSGFPTWSQAGNFAVQIFFAISGWLIGGILLRSKTSDLPKFYFNRAARIWIPYFVAIALLMIVSLAREPITEKWVEIFFYDLTFTYNFFGPPQLALFGHAMPLDGTGSHFWSICAEEQFYLFAPFLITLAAAFTRSLWFWLALSALFIWSPVADSFGSISLGVLAAVLRAKTGDWQTGRVALVGLSCGSVAMFAVTYYAVIPYAIGAPLSAVLIVLLFAQPGNNTDFSLFVGGMSYPMYLNHWIGIFVAHALFRPFGLRDSIYAQLLSVIIALAVAAILYVVVDKTVKARRNQYFTRTGGKCVAITGFTLLAVGLVGGFFYW